MYREVWRRWSRTFITIPISFFRVWLLIGIKFVKSGKLLPKVLILPHVELRKKKKDNCWQKKERKKDNYYSIIALLLYWFDTYSETDRKEKPNYPSFFSFFFNNRVSWPTVVVQTRDRSKQRRCQGVTIWLTVNGLRSRTPKQVRM